MTDSVAGTARRNWRDEYRQALVAFSTEELIESYGELREFCSYDLGVNTADKWRLARAAEELERRLAELAGLRTQLEQATSELRYIDAALDRRPALADIPNRYSKIESACYHAGKADIAEARLKTVTAQLEQAQRELQIAWTEAAEGNAELVKRAETAELALSSLQGALRELLKWTGPYVEYVGDAPTPDEVRQYAADARGAAKDALWATENLASPAGIIGKVAFLDGPDSESSATTEHLHGERTK